MIALDHCRIRVWQDVNDDSAKCQIGDYWFYFTHIEEDDCLENFATDELAEMIADVINHYEENGLDAIEADYYKNAIAQIVYDVFVEETCDKHGQVNDDYYSVWLSKQ